MMHSTIVLLKRFIIEAAKRQNRRSRAMYLRFGDPRRVAKHSMIHNPQVAADAEEYLSFDVDGPNLQQYENGISAYKIIDYSSNHVNFQVPDNVQNFYVQVNGFLFERIINNDAYVFFGESIGIGTDGEPVIDKSSITRVKKVSVASLYANGKQVTSMIDSWNLMHFYDMGYDEFFQTKNVTSAQITTYIDSVKQILANAKQLKIMDEIEDAWLMQLEEDSKNA